jgi:hypothetical protein
LESALDGVPLLESVFGGILLLESWSEAIVEGWEPIFMGKNKFVGLVVVSGFVILWFGEAGVSNGNCYVSE